MLKHLLWLPTRRNVFIITPCFNILHLSPLHFLSSGWLSVFWNGITNKNKKSISKIKYEANRTPQKSNYLAYFSEFF